MIGICRRQCDTRGLHISGGVPTLPERSGIITIIDIKIGIQIQIGVQIGIQIGILIHVWVQIWVQIRILIQIQVILHIR